MGLQRYAAICVVQYATYLPDYFIIGNALASTGDEGSVRLWRKGIDDAFVEFADVGPED